MERQKRQERQRQGSKLIIEDHVLDEDRSQKSNPDEDFLLEDVRASTENEDRSRDIQLHPG